MAASGYAGPMATVAIFINGNVKMNVLNPIAAPFIHIVLNKALHR